MSDENSKIKDFKLTDEEVNIWLEWFSDERRKLEKQKLVPPASSSSNYSIPK